MGHKKGEYEFLHPNDHVNCSQSTNDAYPTAIKLTVLLSLKDLLAAMDQLKDALEEKAEEFVDVLNLPPMQPGSSIMPGKVNPVIPELVNQICYQIIGYDAVVSMAAEASELELCMAEPIIAYDLLHGMLILKNACITLLSRCIVDIEAKREVCRQYVENSIGLVTALNPVLGYEKSVSIILTTDTGHFRSYELK